MRKGLQMRKNYINEVKRLIRSEYNKYEAELLWDKYGPYFENVPDLVKLGQEGGEDDWEKVAYCAVNEMRSRTMFFLEDTLMSYIDEGIFSYKDWELFEGERCLGGYSGDIETDEGRLLLFAE